jgi:hypothetical protein
MKRLLLILSLFVLMLSACGTTGPQPAVPSPTGNPIRETSPAASETPAREHRTTAEELAEFLLKPEDLPVEAHYYLPDSSYTSPYDNTAVVSSWGGEKGWEYLQRTGRVDGYWVEYLRGSEDITAPEEMFCNIVKFETTQGAQLSLTDYNLVVIDAPDGKEWSFVNLPELDLGDTNIILTSKELQDNGENRIWYRIEFTYKSYVGVVAGHGWEDEVQPEFIERAARSVLAKLEGAP